ncbi:MAG: response regulator transcription factor [Clostridia bacterium]|nr:response regulator transcription factor [Clostridia bacterium]
MIKFRLVIFEKENEIREFLQSGNITIISHSELKTNAAETASMSADAVIIDMSSYDKTQVLRYINENGSTNIFAVNADEAIKYQIYECGAVDVMVKPLDKIELKYKIDIAISKSKYHPKRYCLGDLVYEIETGTLIKEHRSIVLPSLQNKIFAQLLNSYYENRIVRKEEVFDSLVDESSRIQNHIARLRFSLSYIKSRQVVIETVYGKGYKLFVMDN